MSDDTPDCQCPTVTIDLVEHLAEQVEQLAKATGRADLRHSARVLRKELVLGRRPVDDTTGLGLVRQLLAEGRGPWSACMIAARKLNPDKVESVARRLFNKIPKEWIFSGSRSFSIPPT